MLEPLMRREKLTTAPVEKDWADIHEYALKIESYLNTEELAGRYYTPKEKLDMFIEGLGPHYHPAIKRARSLLDNTSPADPSVPEVLKIAALPLTFERWMKEETGQAVCRAAYSTSKKGADNGGQYQQKHLRQIPGM
mmetsp:Transcript_1093/g.1657  ORF Transcript_1093/g.1657 Transcript_1093/m.1657 type:complete len:137 (+) Transcript_1093:1553-1963(+)